MSGFDAGNQHPAVGEALYEPAQQLLDSTSVETLSARVTELRDVVRGFEEQAGAESPRAAAITDAELDAAAMTERLPR